MGFKISGLDRLQRELSEAQAALASLDGEIAALRFNPHDPISVESAIVEMENAIDARVGSYQENRFVAPIIAQLKEKYRHAILNRASEANIATGESMSDSQADPALLRQIENTVNDLRRADTQTFDRHIKKLSRLLHAEPLEPIVQELCKGIDFDAWLRAGHATQRGMLGSATLEWPADDKQELGTVILLIDSFVEKGADYAFDFAHIFYTISSNSISVTLQNMVAQLFVPFARDFIAYVQSVTAPPRNVPKPREMSGSNKVFVVHGHNDAPKEAVARFLMQLGLDPVILHEQPSRGRTIIEKIEAHRDVGFAVVLLTPDDFGGPTGGEASPKPRARQNVLIELGYFVGVLGRERVCALKYGDLEVPSDFDGVIYQPFDPAGAWKSGLGRELQAAGFEIDGNKLIRA